MATLLERASIILPGDKCVVLPDQQLLLEGKFIAEFGTTLDTFAFTIDQRIDCSGKIIIPGLINGHSHLTETLQKSFRDNERMESWREYRAQTEEVADLQPEEIEAAAQLACAELLKNGVTTVVDHFSTRPGLSLEKMDSILKAFEKTGIRGVLAPSLRDQDPLSLLRKRGGSRSLNTGKKNIWEDISILVDRIQGSAAALMLAPASPQNCSDSLLREVIAVAEKFDLGIHTHLLETRLGRWIGDRLYKNGLFHRMKDLGFLSDRLSAAHCIWLENSDIELLARSGVTVVHCPASNLKLGSGIAPIIKMRQKGINVALGTDGGDTSDTYSIFEQMRLAAFLSRVTEEDSNFWITSNNVLQMATAGGAQGLPAWRNKIGSIAKGYRADLVILKPNIRLRPLNDLVHQIVFCEAGHSVDMVIVDGQIVLKDGILTRVDEQSLVSKAEEISRRMYNVYSKIYPGIAAESKVPELYNKIRHSRKLNTYGRGIKVNMAT
jgi:cytosine/adenosine deaminase-related metal-dependent hydrolase